MRRKDREVIDVEKIENIIKKCYCCRIGFNDNGKVYIVPLNFGYKRNGNCYTLYFHGAKAGKKFELSLMSPEVGFELDTGYQLKTANIACEYSAFYQSIIGNGKICVIDDYEEKLKALNLIMEHNTKIEDWKFNKNLINSVAVFKIDVTDLSCKEHIC